MDEIDKAQHDLCGTCYLNEMGLCSPEKEVCGDVMRRSVAYLLAESAAPLFSGDNDESR